MWDFIRLQISLLRLMINFHITLGDEIFTDCGNGFVKEMQHSIQGAELANENEEREFSMKFVYWSQLALLQLV